MDIAGGNTSETTNGVVAVVDNAGNPVDSVEVLLMGTEFNPIMEVTNQNIKIFRGITNYKGFVEFDSIPAGTYNLLAQTDNGLKGLRSSVVVDEVLTEDRLALLEESVMVDTTGTLKLRIASTLSPGDGSVYFKGTPFKSKIQDEAGSEYKTAVFDSLPQGILPPAIAWSVYENPFVLAQDLSVAPNDTVSKNIDDDQDIEDLWEFSLISRVSYSVLGSFDGGGKEEFREAFESQLRRAEEVFNRDDAFNGKIRFYLDSLQLFTEGETFDTFDIAQDYAFDFFSQKPHESSLGTLTRLRGWFNYRENADNFFTDAAAANLVSMLAQLRGAYRLSSENVYPDKNDVLMSEVTIEYDDETYVDFPQSATQWHYINRSIINHNADHTGNERDLIHAALPDEMQIEVKDQSTGKILEGVEVLVYPRQYADSLIPNTVIGTQITDEAGKVYFSGSLYKKNHTGDIAYSNLLVIFNYDGSSFYSFIPLSDVVETWLEEGDRVYERSFWLPLN
jgi:hypothetical protein